MPNLAHLSTTLPYHQHIKAQGCEIMGYQPWRWINSQADRLQLELVPKTKRQTMRVGQTSDNLGWDITHIGLNI